MHDVYDAPSTVPAILLVLVLTVSGCAKLAARSTADEAFISLRLPVILRKIKAPALLPFGELALAVVLVFAATRLSGSLAMVAILAVGFFNSIMFPTIFTLAIDGLGDHTSQGSGILCMAIAGGAIVPLLQGVLADNYGLQLSFLLPIVCYVFIAHYGFKGHKHAP